MERYNCTRDSWISTMHVNTNFKMKGSFIIKIKFVGSTTSTLLVQLLQPLQRRKEKNYSGRKTTLDLKPANVKYMFPHIQIKMIHAQNVCFLYFCMCTYCVYIHR